MSEIKPWRENIGKPEAYMIMCDVLDVLCEKEAIKKAVYESLKRAPSTYEWVPCNKRLPEKDGYYLVSEDDGGVEVEWYDNTGWGYCGVIAWRPLPPVYREDDNK